MKTAHENKNWLRTFVAISLPLAIGIGLLFHFL
jgi:hypothetical protein